LEINGYKESLYLAEGRKDATLLETLWYHYVVSGHFGKKGYSGLFGQLFDFIGQLVCDKPIRLIGLDSSGIFCGLGEQFSGTSFYKKQPIRKEKVKKVLDRYGRLCHFCGRELSGKGSDTHIHHLMPEVIGGKATLKNLRPVCFSCHGELHRLMNVEMLSRKISKKEYAEEQTRAFLKRKLKKKKRAPRKPYYGCRLLG
jgi:hypothetical protein